MSKKIEEYDADSIRQLKGLEAVRVRPQMYLGSITNGDALHHCIKEVVDNSVDEHLAGHCTSISVTLEDDGVCSVLDNGRGIPVGINKAEGVSALQLVLCNLSAGGKFDNDSYAKSAGLHGIGVSAVNAVSEKMTAVVDRDGYSHHLTCLRGVPDGDVVRVGKSKGRGTLISWKRDLEIFSGATEYDRKRVEERLRELAFLNPGLRLTLLDRRGGQKVMTEFFYEGGIKDYLVEVVGKKKTQIPVMFFTDQKSVSLAFCWTESQEENVRCYANNTFNPDGGTHATGFKGAMTRIVQNYAKEHGLLKDLPADGITGNDIREGLVAIVNMRISNPSFSSQTKDKLVTPEAKTLVEDLFVDQIVHYFEQNPATAKRIAERAVVNAKAREAARRAREGVQRKHLFDQWELPGKLSDCQSKDPSVCEIVIVEGDSAGGSAKAGRDRRTQAILPLRGKILNTEESDAEAISANREISTIIGALGCGIEQDRSFNLKKLRYGRVIIMTDADDDGAHIRTLLLTLFYRAMPALIRGGHVFVAQPPLFKIMHKKSTQYFIRAAEAEAYLNELGVIGTADERRAAMARGGIRITRFKGLGEMGAEELWQTTMNPENRSLLQVHVEDAIRAEQQFALLMGGDVLQRKDWILDSSAWGQTG